MNTIRQPAWAVISVLLSAVAPPPAAGQNLLAELGCGGCHPGVPVEENFRSKTPDLTFAGERYQPAWLFRYLQQPEKIRVHIGRSRMPDFNFSAEQALAVTLFLQEQKSDPSRRPFAAISEAADTDEKIPTPELISQTGCLQCHTLDGTGAGTAAELTRMGRRLQQDWLQNYLVQPQFYGVSAAVMPALFFTADSTRGTLQQRLPGARRKITEIARFLAARGKDERREDEELFRQARTAFPNATAELGEKLFLSQNCLACHRLKGLEAPWQYNAPPLAGAGGRLRSGWLADFLQKPTVVRPAGYFPGSGSRMPDFHLDDEEVREILTFLKPEKESNADVPAPLSPFARRKIEKMLHEKLSCLGCHQLDGRGGRVGPDLSAVGSRLQPAFIAALLRDPVAVLGHRAMPAHPMPAGRREALVRYLTHKTGPATAQSLPEFTPWFYPQNPRSAPELYRAYCASCHGLQGQGDGFNASFLPVKPTAHADRAAMAPRADDTLFDGIAAGGMILDKHPFMPAWGKTLRAAEIRSLVAYMRTLCRCTQPEWAQEVRGTNRKP